MKELERPSSAALEAFLLPTDDPRVPRTFREPSVNLPRTLEAFLLPTDDPRVHRAREELSHPKESGKSFSVNLP